MKLKLIHGDCLEEMKRLPDRSIDLFLCDLPYGCLTGGGGKEKAKRRSMVRYVDGTPTDNTAVYNGGVIAGCDWDVKIDLEAFWIQVERLMKDDHTPIIHFCNTKFGFELMKSKESWFRYDLVWNKNRGVSFLSANKMPMRSHENIYVFSKKGARYNRIDEVVEGKTAYAKPNDLKQNPENIYGITDRLPREQPDGHRCVLSVINQFTCPSSKTRGNHPTQKPADLYKWLIERYSNPGDTILDPTAGSFTSCFTAIDLGRQAIGIEKDDKFYEKAKALVKE